MKISYVFGFRNSFIECRENQISTINTLINIIRSGRFDRALVQHRGEPDEPGTCEPPCAAGARVVEKDPIENWVHVRQTEIEAFKVWWPTQIPTFHLAT